MVQARGQLGDDDIRQLSAAVTVSEPVGDVRLLHRDADYDDRARYRHLLAQHRVRHEVTDIATCSGVTMGWLLRLVTGGPTGGRGPPTVLEFLVINLSVWLVLLSNC